MENTTKQKVFVDQEGVAVIECPTCSKRKSTRVDPSAIREKDLRDHCPVRCTCQTRFAIKLEFRSDPRRPSNLSGEFMILPRGRLRGGITIANVSRGGMGLRIDGADQFKVGDELLVLFTIDGNNDSLIEKRATIRYIAEDYIGCEFSGSLPLGKAFGDYLESLSTDQPAPEQTEVEQVEFDWTGRFMR